jgi:hypothetical protein
MTRIIYPTIAAIALIVNDIDRAVVAQTNNSNNNKDTQSLQKTITIEVDRESLCAKFPQNSHCLKDPIQITRIQLDRSGEDDEWIRIERDENKYKLLHTTQVEEKFTSSLLRGLLSIASIPSSVLPKTYFWEDHKTNRVSFKPDGCADESCIVVGEDTLDLPKEADIRAGILTIEYVEGELTRSIALRIPADSETETIDTVTFTFVKNTQESILPEMAQKLEQKFDEADADKNGVLTLAEAKEGMPSRIWENFDLIDADSSGTVALAEIYQAFASGVMD